MTEMAHRRLTVMAFSLLATLAVLAPGGAFGEEPGSRFVDSIGTPESAIGERELEREVGFGLAGANRGATPRDRVAVILWDETKPRRPQPNIANIGLPGSTVAGASITINVGGRPGW